MAATLSSASAIPHYRTNASSGRVLLGNPGSIKIADYDGSNFKFSLNQVVEGSPSWMALSSANTLFAVDENSSNLRLFNLDTAANTLVLKTQQVGSAGVVHLEFNKQKTRMVGAAYGTGKIDVWNIENNGLKLIKTLDSVGKLGPGQDGRHPHQSLLDPSGRFFAVNDLGSDTIVLIDSKDDAFKISSTARLPTNGCGPRHGAFYPQGAAQATHYVVVCELANEVHLFSLAYTPDTINFTPVQKLSTFGKDFPPATSGAAAGELILAPNNEDLYISNRVTGNSTDSIAHFKVNKAANGTVNLSFKHSTSTTGVNPRMISFSKDAGTIFVGNIKSGNGLAALTRGADGILEDGSKGSLPVSAFGAEGFGPQFVLQIE
ncbi:Fc.00g001800.m01.CDS01 [Cosmosporella sp. VM-42]